ncbi:DUF1361 domain-containing protein [Agrilactobacillus fermenti]|uniref:DUF1361 domain-containing protein n=1 Tax=Agrilactobacillus fermenti TaxID=2586909 RepID=UPI001E5B54FE|nr:DUF1361 domain-containing protein [Agrilactobacillus fermenti]MCD2255911.1 DUF1361 domain-containing protein [Agrilactobacillus fermenti]
MSILILIGVSVLFNLYAIGLILLRPKLFKVKLYRPMIKNFYLALLPLGWLLLVLGIYTGLTYITALTQLLWLHSVALVILTMGLLAWLLLLPNSAYLVTELNLNHREQDTKEVPIWYDIISVLSFALSGVLDNSLNIVILQYTYFIVVDSNAFVTAHLVLFWLVTILLILMVSFGVYLGRYIRFNSWDILHPTSFLHKFFAHFKVIRNVKSGLLFTLTYGVFLMLSYASTYLLPISEIFR